MRQRERERQAEGEQAPRKESSVGLDPGTPGSYPKPKADAQPLSHPRVPDYLPIRNSIFCTKIIKPETII